MSFMLNTNELIIENVLKYLPYRHLKNLMKLNSHWHSAAQRVLRKRSRPGFLYWNKQEAVAIAMHYSNFLNDMYAAPNTVITFASEDFSHFRSSRKMNTIKMRRFDCDVTLKREIEKAVESSVGKVLVTSYATFGVVGSGNSISPGPLECFTKPAATSVFWPERDDLVIKVTTSLEEIRQGIQAERNGLSLKLFMFFYDHSIKNIENESWPMNCVVAGSKVSSLWYNSLKSPTLGISFYGKPNVEVASVIVTGNELDLEIVEKRLTELLPFLKRKFCGDKKDAEFNVKEFSHRIQGYAFVCADRLPATRKKNCFDLVAFAKVFPGVPLFGIGCYGEIGMNSRDENDLCKEDRFVMGDHLNFVSSVFVLLAM